MINKVKDIDRKEPHNHFFIEIISIKNFVPNDIKIDEKSYKNIVIYYVEYLTIKDSEYVKINSVNPLYLIFINVNGQFEEIDGNKYLTLVPANGSQEKKWKIMKNFGSKAEIYLDQEL